MTQRLLRLAYAIEFLVALVAIFTAWSEIGGQAALDLMHWGFKLGLSLALAASMVAYTAALIAEDAVWTLRSARWFTAMILVSLAIAAVTYYYAQQVDTGESDETTISSSRRPALRSDVGAVERNMLGPGRAA